MPSLHVRDGKIIGNFSQKRTIRLRTRDNSEPEVTGYLVSFPEYGEDGINAILHRQHDSDRPDVSRNFTVTEYHTGLAMMSPTRGTPNRMETLQNCIEGMPAPEQFHQFIKNEPVLNFFLKK